MAEVAGLVLGALPLTIWALEKYAEPLETYSHYRTSIETFRTNLILQNRQLQTTLSSIGLGSQPSSGDLRECFSTKFPDISHELMFLVKRMDETADGLMKSLDISGYAETSTLPEKAHWEWRRVKHSLSTKKRNKVIDDLRNWNEDLRRALEKSEVPAEDDSHKVQELKRRFNIQRCNSIRQCFRSLHRALEAGFSCTCSPPHQAAVDLDWTAHEAHEEKGFKVAISYRTQSQQIQHLESWRKLHVTLDTTHKSSSTALEVPARTFIPVKASSSSVSSLRSKMAHFSIRSPSKTPSPPPPLTDSPSRTTTPSAISDSESTEITNLCDTVCTTRRPCDLLGILKDPDQDQDRKFSVNHKDTYPSKAIKTISLKSLLTSPKQPAPQQKPYLLLPAKQRYGIAASLAWSVLHLSGSPWLGDYWDENQANIFLEENQDAQEILALHPCASYIFSTPNPAHQPPSDDFGHLIPNKAVFALGVLLIELCINQSLLTIRQAGERATRGSLLDDYQAVLSKLSEVYSTAGDSYGYAAERCVKFSFQGRDLYKNFDFSQFRQQFYETVVAPVQATYLMFPDSRIPI